MADKLSDIEKSIKILHERQINFEQETKREFKRLRLVINENQKQIDEILEEYDETIEGIHYRTDGLYLKLKETKFNLLKLQESFCYQSNQSDESQICNGTLHSTNNYQQTIDSCETESEFYSETQSANDDTFDK